MSATAEAIYSRHRLSVEDYHRMGEAGILGDDDRVELIAGEIIDMSPIGTHHASAVKRISNRVKLQVGERAIVSTQDPVHVDRFNEPEPDIALLRPQDDFYSDAHPIPADVLLIVEVAETSLRYDRDVKVPLYASAGIPEVWLVDIAGQVLWIYREPGQGAYRSCERAPNLSNLAPLLMPDASVDLRGLF